MSGGPRETCRLASQSLERSNDLRDAVLKVVCDSCPVAALDAESFQARNTRLPDDIGTCLGSAINGVARSREASSDLPPAKARRLADALNGLNRIWRLTPDDSVARLGYEVNQNDKVALHELTFDAIGIPSNVELAKEWPPLAVAFYACLRRAIGGGCGAYGPEDYGPAPMCAD